MSAPRAREAEIDVEPTALGFDAPSRAGSNEWPPEVTLHVGYRIR